MPDNMTQLSSGGTSTYQEDPSSGPFGFGPAYLSDGSKCIIDGHYAKRGDQCIINPKYCLQGLSFSIWEKVTYPKSLLETDPNTGSFTRQYVFSTGADVDLVSNVTVPGMAVYHYGMDLVAVVSTGDDVWQLSVRGQLTNTSFTNIGIRWNYPNLDNRIVLNPADRGGLEMYVNQKKVGQAVQPLPRPSTNWIQFPPLRLPAKDPSGNIIPNKFDGAPVIMFGCHYAQVENGANLTTPTFKYFHAAVFDEMAIWTRKLVTNKTVDETLYFIGGYQASLEGMTPEKFSSLLENVDMTDPDQAAAASSMTGTLMTAGGSGSGAKGGGSSSGGSSTSSSGGSSAALTVVGASLPSWMKTEINKQLVLVDLYSKLLTLDGVVDGTIPKHLDSRFNNILTVASMLSCDSDNVMRWRMVQEDDDLPGSSDMVDQIETYAMEYMASANISYYANTPYFNANLSEYIVMLPSRELFLSVQKMPMARFRARGPNFDVGAYQNPPALWAEALAYWDEPADSISIPTEMFVNQPQCINNSVTFLYSIYPCYSQFAPLRRNPFSVNAERFVLDSKVISVRFQVNNESTSPGQQPVDCQNPDIDAMKYTPVKIKFQHVSPETSRRKVLFHDEFTKTSIDVRLCVMWNPDIGMFGGWDANGCTTVVSDQDSTTCECAAFGTYAVAAEKISKPVGKTDYSWLQISKYVGYSLSILSLVIFVLVIAVSPALWEMFHLIRLNTGLCYLCALSCHFASELELVRTDRHSNAALSSVLLFFYLAGSYFQMLEAFAGFRAITAGIIGGKTAGYIPLGWGFGFVGLGFTWFMYGNDVGTDPNVFIGWENETKLPFFILNYIALGTSLLLSSIVLFNAATAQARKEDSVEHLQAQGQGLAITNFLFAMVWGFAYPAYIKFPGREMRDFYPVFSMFIAWMGLVILIFLGVSSKRFRTVLFKCCQCKKSKKTSAPPPGEDDRQLILPPASDTAPPSPRPASAEPAVPSRPGSAWLEAAPEEDEEAAAPADSRPGSAGSLPGAVQEEGGEEPPQEEEEEEQQEEQGEEEKKEENNDDYESD